MGGHQGQLFGPLFFTVGSVGLASHCLVPLRTLRPPSWYATGRNGLYQPLGPAAACQARRKPRQGPLHVKNA